MLLDKGYKDIVAIETKSSIPKKYPKDKNSQVFYIKPSEKPGRVMNFTSQSTERAIQIGYLDGLKLLRGYVGQNYFIDVSNKSPFGYGLCDLNDDLYVELAHIFGEIYAGLPQLTEVINKELKLKGKNFAESILSLYEKIAYLEGVDRLKIYYFDEFIGLVKDNIYKLSVDTGSKMFKEIKIIMTIDNYFRHN